MNAKVCKHLCTQGDCWVCGTAWTSRTENTLNSHTFRCASNAEWNAYENMMDAEVLVTINRESVQDEAASYLLNGMVTCICNTRPLNRFVSNFICSSAYPTQSQIKEWN